MILLNKIEQKIIKGESIHISNGQRYNTIR